MLISDGIAYYVAFGPHGPREPILAPGGGAKTAGGIIISIALASLMFYGVRQLGTLLLVHTLLSFPPARVLPVRGRREREKRG